MTDRKRGDPGTPTAGWGSSQQGGVVVEARAPVSFSKADDRAGFIRSDGGRTENLISSSRSDRRLSESFVSPRSLRPAVRGATSMYASVPFSCLSHCEQEQEQDGLVRICIRSTVR